MEVYAWLFGCLILAALVLAAYEVGVNAGWNMALKHIREMWGERLGRK